VSQENVELVARLLDAFNRRDVEAFSADTTPDFEWFPAFRDALERGDYLDREGARKYVGELDETWDDLVVIPEEYRDLGDRVLVIGWFEARGKGSGAAVRAPMWTVYDLEGGKVARVRPYFERDEALKAAGLEE
jgi:ketosteroid isomerase-like protein